MVGDNRHDLEIAPAGGVGLAIGVLSGTGAANRWPPLADVVLELDCRAAGLSDGSGVSRRLYPRQWGGTGRPVRGYGICRWPRPARHAKIGSPATFGDRMGRVGGINLDRHRRVFGAFFLLGIGFGSIFTRIDDIQLSMGVGQGALGAALVGTAVGMMVSVTFFTRWLDRIGYRPMLLVAVPMMGLLTALSSLRAVR